MGDTDLFNYRPPAGAAAQVRETSRAAHESIKPDASRIAGRILDAIKARPRTCAELEDDLSLSHQTCSARITHLNKDEKIVDSGERRRTASGRKAIVWRVKE